MAGETDQATSRIENSGTNSHISNPHLTVTIGGAPGKHVLYAGLGALVALALLLLMTVAVARDAQRDVTGNSAEQVRFEKRVNDRVAGLVTEARLMALWAQRAAITCEAKGVKLPPVPQ